MEFGNWTVDIHMSWSYNELIEKSQLLSDDCCDSTCWKA